MTIFGFLQVNDGDLLIIIIGLLILLLIVVLIAAQKSKPSKKSRISSKGTRGVDHRPGTEIPPDYPGHISGDPGSETATIPMDERPEIEYRGEEPADIRPEKTGEEASIRMEHQIVKIYVDHHRTGLVICPNCETENTSERKTCISCGYHL